MGKPIPSPTTRAQHPIGRVDGDGMGFSPPRAGAGPLPPKKGSLGFQPATTSAGTTWFQPVENGPTFRWLVSAPLLSTLPVTAAPSSAR